MVQHCRPCCFHGDSTSQLLPQSHQDCWSLCMIHDVPITCVVAEGMRSLSAYR